MTTSRTPREPDPDSSCATGSVGPAPVSDPGLTVEGYRVLQRIGEGGMGEVYLAEQLGPIRRRVALKVIKPGLDSREVVARFESERQALALMSHPCIARVYDAGATAQGRPFFVMEHVQGVSVTEHCDRHRLSIRERLELFIEVCEGVQHAHQKAIIHRDLKPSNVLVTVHDGRAMPKIIDFGVAKATAQRLTDTTMFTELGQLIGTIEYMSPEQADLGGQDIDTRTDVYALGVMLYELLVGELPFDRRALRRMDFDGMRRVIREQDPPRPSSRLEALTATSGSPGVPRRTHAVALPRQLRGDLDWIILKALEKDRNRRFASASELAADLRRHLANVPVVASPPSTLYRLAKFVRRHRVGVVAACSAAVALLVGLTLATVGFVRASHERDRKEAALVEARSVTDFLARMLEAVDPSAGSRDVTVREVLDQASRQIGTSLAGQPLVEAQLRHTLGTSYLGLGLLTEAEQHVRAAVGLRERHLGAEHPDTLASKEVLAEVYLAQGRSADAERLGAQLVESRTRVLGADHRDTRWSEFNLANVYFQEARYDDAARLYRSTLSFFEASLGADHPDTLSTAFNLASVHWARGELAEAEPLYLRALEGRTRTLGPEHPATIDAMNNLAALYHVAGRLDEAERLYTEAIETGTRVRGAEHPETLVSRGNLGELRADQGRLEEARAMLGEVVELKRRVLGPDHPSTRYSADVLARVVTAGGAQNRR